MKEIVFPYNPLTVFMQKKRVSASVKNKIISNVNNTPDLDEEWPVFFGVTKYYKPIDDQK